MREPAQARGIDREIDALPGACPAFARDRDFERRVRIPEPDGDEMLVAAELRAHHQPAQGATFRGGEADRLAREQHARPAVAVGRSVLVRRQPQTAETVIIAAADPLNLVGILTPGPRISPFTQQVIVYRSGVPVETGALGAVKSRLQMRDTASP